MVLDNVKMIIDVGARDTDFPNTYPDAKCHLFEPHPIHCKVLREKFSNWDVVINEFGIGSTDEILPYDQTSESFVVGAAKSMNLPLKSLDAYLKKKRIKHIDILKVDTEAMDYAILKSNPMAVDMARYIIFETWDNYPDFQDLLSDDFYMLDIGLRNILCKRKKSNSRS